MTTESTNPATSGEPLNTPEPVTPVESQPSNNQPTIPYQRFQEVNNKYRELESRYNNAVQILQQVAQSTVPQEDKEKGSYDPEKYWEKAGDDPKSWEDGVLSRFKEAIKTDPELRSAFVGEVFGTLSKEQQNEQLIQSNIQRLSQTIPAVSEAKVQELVLMKAKEFNQTMPSSATVEEVFDAAAKWVSDFLPKPTSNQPPVYHPGNLVSTTPESVVDELYNKALKTGDVTTMLQLKLRGIDRK